MITLFVLLTVLLMSTMSLNSFYVNASELSELHHFTISDQFTTVYELDEDLETCNNIVKDGSLTTGDFSYWVGVYKYYNILSDRAIFLIVNKSKMTPRPNNFDHVFRNRYMKMGISFTSVDFQTSLIHTGPYLPSNTFYMVSEGYSYSINSDGTIASTYSFGTEYSEVQVSNTESTTYPESTTNPRLLNTSTFIYTFDDTTANKATMIFNQSAQFYINNYSTHIGDKFTVTVMTDAYFFRDGFWNDRTTNAQLSKDILITI